MEQRLFTLDDVKAIVDVALAYSQTSLCERLGIIEPKITKAKAEKIYGRDTIKRWDSHRLITPQYTYGEKRHTYYLRSECEAAYRAENTFLSKCV